MSPLSVGTTGAAYHNYFPPSFLRTPSCLSSCPCAGAVSPSITITSAVQRIMPMLSPFRWRTTESK